MCKVYATRVVSGKQIPVQIIASLTEDDPAAPGPVLTICQRGNVDLYRCVEYPVITDNCLDRLFQLRHLADPKTIGSLDAYWVLVSGSGLKDDRCDCAGFTYLERCKHADALRGLILAGEIPHPHDQSANLALANHVVNGICLDDTVPF